MSIIGLLVSVGGFLVACLVIYGIVWDGIIGTFREKWEANSYDKGFERGQAFEREKKSK